MTKRFVVAAIVAAAMWTGTAQADLVTLSPSDVGSSFTLDYNGFTGAGTIAGLTGSTTFTLTGATDTQYTFDYSVSNTSSAPITASRISGFGFDTNPNITSASSTGVFDTVGTGNAPNIGSVDVCFKGGGGTNNCAGGGGDGVTLGDNTAGTLTLDFGAPISSLSLDDFFVRYQSIAGAGGITSAVGTGTLSSSGGSTSTSTGGTPVPEPSTMLLFGLAAGGLVFGGVRLGAPKPSMAALAA